MIAAKTDNAISGERGVPGRIQKFKKGVPIEIWLDSHQKKSASKQTKC